MNLTDEFILDIAEDSATYNKGITYFLNRRVLSINYDKVNNIVSATVLGSKIYDVNIYFLRYNDSIFCEYDCECPVFTMHHETCKHVIAVLKHFQQGYIKQERNLLDTAIQDIFTSFEGGNIRKQLLKSEFSLEFSSDYVGNISVCLNLKVGTDKLYTIRNISRFINSLITNQDFKISKNLTLDPTNFTLKEEHENVLNILKDLHLYYQNYIGYYSNSYSRDKNIFLSYKMMESVLSCLSEINLTLFGKKHGNVKIINGDIDVDISLKEQGSDLVLSLNNNHDIYFLNPDSTVVFYKDTIYMVSAERKNPLEPFLRAYNMLDNNTITLSETNKSQFISQVLPQVIDKIKIDKEMLDNFYKEELDAKIFIDKIDGRFILKVEFRYGDEIINPFLGKQVINKENKLLIRDVEKEHKILDILENLNFLVGTGELYTEKEKDIYPFLDNFATLKKYAEILYTDNCVIRIRDTTNLGAKVRLNDDRDLLEVDFDLDGISYDEVIEVFKSVKLRKKYHKLRDGSFLFVDNEKYLKIEDLLDKFNINPKNLKSGHVDLKKHNAFYINSKFDDLIEKSFNFEKFLESIKEPKNLEFEIPSVVSTILRNYQQTGFKWLKALSHYKLGGILADDMGLGKTLQIIAFILSEKEANPTKNEPVLVICPTSLVYNWISEIEKFAPSLKSLAVSGTRSIRSQQMQAIGQSDVIVTSYPLIRRDIEFYKKFKFSYCIIDEAQHIKNPTTVNAKAVKEIKAKGYFALTGTPIENNLTELWSIFDFVMPGYLSSHSKFSQRFEVPIVKNQDKEVLNDLILFIQPFILRRIKKDVLLELPDKIETKIVAEMTPEQNKLYHAYLLSAKSELQEELSKNGFEKSKIKILALLTRLRQICCHPALFIENYNDESGKFNLLKEILEETIEAGHRVLVFSQYTTMLKMIRDYLTDCDISHFYLDGDVKSELRSKLVQNFNNGSTKIFLISLKAGGTGLNLTGADTVIHFDPWWNPAVEEQATDRAHRIGQKNVVQVIKLVTKNTIEEKILDLQEKKKSLIDSVIKTGEVFINKMSREEIEFLFEE